MLAAGQSTGNFGGVPELVTDGHNGLLVPTDTGSVAGAITRFVHDTELRRRLQRQCRRDTTHLDIARTAQQMQRIYGISPTDQDSTVTETAAALV